MTCANDTRTEILDTIHAWFKDEPVQNESILRTEGNPHGQIFWLDGQAGTGKSTIAQTIACHYHKSGQLGASFFCSRDDAECSNVNMIFPTIAHQLCLFRPVLRKYVSEAMRNDPDLPSAFASMQLEKLIVEPLEAVMRDQTFPPCLITIDALDECKDGSATSTILSALSVFTDRLSPKSFRFFITSRPVPVVERGFHITGLLNETRALVLHNIPLDISQKDIRIYLHHRLSVIARSFGLESWPEIDARDRLVEKSGGLFIFAATAANFVEDPNDSNPIQQLKTVLSATYIASTETSPHRHLDMLYLTVLREAFPKISAAHRVRLGNVLGAIVLVFDPLEPESLEALLGLEERTVRLTLHRLHSIASVPDAGGGPVRLIHPSFHDFLVDGDRCDDGNFVVNGRDRHTWLAERCLRVLQTLSADMCKIGDASVYNQEVSDLAARIATLIPAHVQYACRHWASHLSSGDVHDGMLDLLLKFCLEQLLNWLGVMSLLGELDSTITALQSARRMVEVRGVLF